MSLTASLTTSTPAVVAGGEAIFFVTFTNTGASASVSFSGYLPPPTTYVSIVQTAGPDINTQNAGTAVILGSLGRIALPAGNLPTGEIAVYKIVLLVDPSAPPGTVIMLAISASGTATSLSASVTVVAPVVDLGVLIDGPTITYVDMPTKFIVTVTNNDSISPANDLRLALDVPCEHFSSVQVTGPAFYFLTPTDITISTLSAGAVAKFEVQVCPKKPGLLAIGAAISSSTPDPNLKNNSSSAFTQVLKLKCSKAKK